jgi:solute carrier family 25 citrate transporter 1
MSSSTQKKQTKGPIDFFAGGVAGLCEALCCHPLDTIKVRMQLYKKSGQKPPGFIKTGISIVQKEGFLSLYKGLGAVVIGIVPKMAIRFSSYEFYRSFFLDKDGKITTGQTFLAGVGAGITESVMVVNPMEVVKIRLQAQHHSMKDPLDVPKYRNAPHAAYLIVKEEGFSTLYRGVSLTCARQATNQGANFATYSTIKAYLQKKQNTELLPSWQTSLIGLISGAVGPLTNAPLDTIKTRLQKSKFTTKENGLVRIVKIGKQLVKEEGIGALYKGITPRIMRVAPGQAVVFTVYEAVKHYLTSDPSVSQAKNA